MAEEESRAMDGDQTVVLLVEHVDQPDVLPVEDVAQTVVLLVEDDPVDAQLIQEALASSTEAPFQVEWVTNVADALKRLTKEGIEVVLLDLTLPDGQGIEAFNQVFQAAPETLILVLSGVNDEVIAREAVLRGAHDFLAKSHVDSHWLPRALRYVIERKANREALRKSEAQFRAISDASPLGVFVSDTQGSCVYTNAAYHKISGLSFDDTLGTNWSMAIHPEDRERVLAEWRIAARVQGPFQTEFRFQQSDESIVWTRVNSAAIRAENTSLGLVQTVEDITERKAIEAALREVEESLFAEKERAQVTLDSIGDAVLTTDIAGNLSYMNRVAEAMTGWSRTDAMGRPLAEVFTIVDGETRQAAANPALLAVKENRRVGLATNCVLIRRDGFESAIEDSTAPIHNREGEVAGAVIVFHDVNESRALALKMSHLAQHDFLTGLPNRVLLTERLSRAIGLAHRHGKQVALLFLDLDYFKNINDSLGHATGDELLQSVAERLKVNVRATDTVCRQGGDEFVVLLTEIERPLDASLIAEKLQISFASPHLVAGQELHVTLSIGISIYPDDGLDLDTVLQNADTAMYHAKARGRNNFQFFRPDMNTRAVRRLQVESSIRRALKDGEFFLHFQPQIELSSGVITGTEALIRWQDPEQGLIPPGQFIPVAEECGLIVPIGRWVLREACRQVKEWLDAGLKVVPVSVNISAVEFRHKDFLDGVALILKDTGLESRYLELELTESILMHDVESSIMVLESLKAMGVQLAIDDFGTGYSSLNYLKRFPIDKLKIDQSFVRDLATDVDDATIVSAVIGMGKNLRQRVISEGVETLDQFSLLSTRQCPEAQGFLFSYPLLAKDFAALLVTGTIALPA